MPVATALGAHRPRDLDQILGWPFRGPRASEEVFASIRNLGREMFTFHDLWVQNSGVHPERALAHERKCLLTLLGHMISYDQLDASNLACAEFGCRRLLMLERAAKANPRSPDFTGLHMFIEHSLEEAGGIATRQFTEHIAKVAESEARILKQTRLLREETEHKDKRKPGGGGGEKGGGGGGLGSGGKNKEKEKS